MALQHLLEAIAPLCAPPFDEASGKRCPVLRRCRPQGLATLSADWAFAPSRAYFSSQRSWALPFRAFLLPGDRRKVPLPRLRSCASPQDPWGPRIGASAASSHPESRAPHRHPRFYVGSGPCALLGLATSQALPPGILSGKHLPSRISPPALPSRPSHDDRGSEPQGLSIPGLAVSFRRRRRPAWCSGPTVVPQLLRKWNHRWLFFPSRGPNPPCDVLGASLRDDFLPA